MAKDRASRQMTETQSQAFPDIKERKEALENNQTGEGSELLVFKAQAWNAMGFKNGVSLAKLHGKRPPFAVIGFGLHLQFYREWQAAFYFLDKLFGKNKPILPVAGVH
jgi:hypothetical protein